MRTRLAGGGQACGKTSNGQGDARAAQRAKRLRSLLRAAQRQRQRPEDRPQRQPLRLRLWQRSGRRPAPEPAARRGGGTAPHLWQRSGRARRSAPQASLQILTGAAAGREIDLTKNLTTLGKPGLQVAVITRRPQGYFITHVEGAAFPAVNGVALDTQARALKDRDVIELAGVKMEFFINA